jgi:hypothetical protein
MEVPMRRFLLLSFVTLMAAALAGPAVAQRRKRISFTEGEATKVEGQVHKPEVGYILTRQEQEDLETLKLKESFLPKVVDSVEKKPF